MQLPELQWASLVCGTALEFLFASGAALLALTPAYCGLGYQRKSYFSETVSGIGLQEEKASRPWACPRAAMKVAGTKSLQQQPFEKHKNISHFIACVEKSSCLRVLICEYAFFFFWLQDLICLFVFSLGWC